MVHGRIFISPHLTISTTLPPNSPTCSPSNLFSSPLQILCRLVRLPKQHHAEMPPYSTLQPWDPTLSPNFHYACCLLIGNRPSLSWIFKDNNQPTCWLLSGICGEVRGSALALHIENGILASAHCVILNKPLPLCEPQCPHP